MSCNHFGRICLLLGFLHTFPLWVFVCLAMFKLQIGVFRHGCLVFLDVGGVFGKLVEGGGGKHLCLVSTRRSLGWNFEREGGHHMVIQFIFGWHAHCSHEMACPCDIWTLCGVLI